MNTTQRWTVAIIAAIAIGVALFAGGIALGRTGWAMPVGAANMMGGYTPNQTSVAQTPYGNMMNGSTQAVTGTVSYGPGMMNGGYGAMMGYAQNYSGTAPYGMMNGGYGGMMSGNMMGNGMMNNGMMSGLGSSQLYGVKPLSVDQARKAVTDYVTRFNNPDLIVSEIVIFDNNAYARITEKSTGIGAFEVLVDPVTLAVYPEYGPNLMWNLKYGMMSGSGMMGGSMMGGATTAQPTAKMPVSADEAVQTAQRYLDTYLPGAKASAQPDPFYGYYTIEILRDGQTAGMLSVNGYTQQVFLHTWHGKFIELSEG